MRHLEGPKNPDGLNLGICVLVYMCKVHMCMYMLGGGMRSWTNFFSFNIFFLSKKKSKIYECKLPIISNLYYKIGAHRPSIKSTKPLFIVIKVIIIILRILCAERFARLPGQAYLAMRIELCLERRYWCSRARLQQSTAAQSTAAHHARTWRWTVHFPC